MRILTTTLLAICLINFAATSSHGFGLLWLNLCRPVVMPCECCCSNGPPAVDLCGGTVLSERPADAPAEMAHGDIVIEQDATDVPAAPTEVSDGNAAENGNAASEADTAEPVDEDVASPSDLDDDDDAASATDEDATAPTDEAADSDA